MPVSAYVVRCAPEDQSRLRAELAGQPGIELGESASTGFPVAADTPTNRAAAELGERLQHLPGVKAAVLVYHNFEDVADDPAEATVPAP